ncbi:MAG: maleylpyruvate isomerase family mycothiol-dependent enzyme [Ilumatobacteraceae bacterium]
MPTDLPQQPVIAALREEWARIDHLLGTLDDAEWSTPTCLPGWDVKAVVAHLIGTEMMLLGEPSPAIEVPESSTHVRNDIGRFNEAWVVALSDTSPAVVLERFRSTVTRRLEMLDATTAQTWATVGFTPAGQDTYGRFMRIRVFDCWVHEQDIRDAVGRPGGEDGPAAGLAIDEMAAVLGFVVGKKGGAPRGARVRIELTGPNARTVDVEVGERATVVEALSGPPTLHVTMPIGVFARLGGGRVDPRSVRDEISIEGDGELSTELGERIIANMAYTI